MSLRRVVVTGSSVISSLGCDADEVWTRICNGQSGIAPIERFDCSEFAVRFGGEVREFSAHDHMDISPKVIRRLDRFAQFALAGTELARIDAGVDFENTDVLRCGVIIGSGIGGLNEIEAQHSVLFDRGPQRISAFMIPKLIVNAGSGNVTVEFGLKGPSSAVATACASATQAIGSAYRTIQLGQADMMITGGTEAALTPMGLSGFAKMRALSQRNEAPAQASRPFDVGRDGFVMGEGAGILILEDYETAKARGANIVAEVVGYGCTSDGTHMTAPDPNGDGAARCMQMALEDAKLDCSAIDYVNAHATSTPLGDLAETKAIRNVFGSHADAVAVSSTKGHIGHLLGASGGVESVFCLKAIGTQTAPPTLNLDEPDTDCDLDYVPNTARDMSIKYVMKNSFGFGGHNACLIFGAV